MHLLVNVWSALGGPPDLMASVKVTGKGALPSVYRVTELATASIGVAGAASELMAARAGSRPTVVVDRRLASLWFGTSPRPHGQVPPTWHPIAGDDRTTDGWIRLHANAPHHRQIALDVLQRPSERSVVAEAVARWSGEDLEQTIVDRGGCAAMLRSADAWAEHPQGQAVAGYLMAAAAIRGLVGQQWSGGGSALGSAGHTARRPRGYLGVITV